MRRVLSKRTPWELLQLAGTFSILIHNTTVNIARETQESVQTREIIYFAQILCTEIQRYATWRWLLGYTDKQRRASTIQDIITSVAHYLFHMKVMSSCSHQYGIVRKLLGKWLLPLFKLNPPLLGWHSYTYWNLRLHNPPTSQLPFYKIVMHPVNLKSSIMDSFLNEWKCQ